MIQIAVKLEGNKYQNLISLIPGAKREILLTTSYDFQTKGTVNIYLIDRSISVQVDSLIIQDIPPEKAGKSEIKALCSVSKRNRLHIRIFVNGRKRISRIINLNRYIPGKSFGDRIAIGLLVLLLTGIAVLAVTKTQRGNITVNEGVHKSTPGPVPPVRINEVIYFAPDSSVLTTEAEKKLTAIIPGLNRIKKGRIIIRGHCALYGTEKGRTELSGQRAANTLMFLISRGWRPEHTPEVKGYGGKYPVTTDPDKQNLNRRVEIVYP
ncbi:MAG: OmpA family protein [Spirochaetes bacterium]|nr:OmpA family protein [Spirochaetota bacterium]